MKNYIKTYGKIVFDPEAQTSKHEKQGGWKRFAIVELDKDLDDYYRWLFTRRYNLPLIPSLRDSHVTFIADKHSEMNGKWKDVKKKYNGKKVEIYLDIDSIDSDGSAWWLKVPYEHRSEIQSIRDELDLGTYKWGFHMTIGTAVNVYSRNEGDISAIKALQMNEEHSKYVLMLIKKENEK